MQYFLSVIDEGSFSRAALRHRLSQQAVSKSIAALESELGTPLLHRVGRRLETTAAGALLAEHAEAVLAETLQLHRRIEASTGRSAGKLHIGAGPAAAGGIVAKAISSMLSKAPDLQIKLTTGTTSSMTPQLRRGEIDAFVGLLVERHPDPLLESEVLFIERTVLVARPEHPLAGKKQTPLSETLAYPWLAGTGMEHWGDLIKASFVKETLKPPAAKVQTDSVHFACGLVKHSDYLCVLPEQLVREDLDAGKLVAIDVPTSTWQRPMALFRRRQNQPFKLLDKFCAELRALDALTPA